LQSLNWKYTSCSPEDAIEISRLLLKLINSASIEISPASIEIRPASIEIGPDSNEIIPASFKVSPSRKGKCTTNAI
jgi:hypothetical protein